MYDTSFQNWIMRYVILFYDRTIAFYILSSVLFKHIVSAEVPTTSAEKSKKYIEYSIIWFHFNRHSVNK